MSALERRWQARASPKPQPKPDANARAVAAVNAATGSEPLNGEDLLDTEELKKQFREAKEKEAKRGSKAAGES